MKIRYALIIVVGIIASANFSGAAEILNIRYWAAPDHTRVVIDIGSEPSFETQEGEKLLTLTFKESTSRQSLPTEIVINKPGIKKVILNPVSNGSIKAEFILDKYLKTQVFQLKKFQDKPDRVVVDIFLEQAPQEELVKELSSKIKKTKIIVIDPGHGGDDPGAVGKKGTYEKNIVLLISREIKKAVNKIPGYKVLLTRDGDYYVSFNKRLQMAKDLNANLFISVHADAARNRNARGSSVYCLSTGAASNEAAKLLAKNENLSDIIGGVPNGEGKTDSDQIILNMFQTNTINLSKTYAGNLMNQLNKVNTLKHKNVQEAPFRVLKLPDIPAVLIETAYISNGEEERLLKSNNFQKKLALAVASSVTEYLSGTASIAQGNDAVREGDKTFNPREKKPLEKIDDQNEMATSQYKVKRGDTFFSIAQLFNTKIALLLKLNNRKMEDTLYAGQKIKVPVNVNSQHIKAAGDSVDKVNDGKGTARIYMVKKGDTLFSIAKNNSLKIDELRKLNHLKSSDPLLSGQKIKLP
jgi:N-acetylmuramoyl-L-alanine amidase